MSQRPQTLPHVLEVNNAFPNEHREQIARTLNLVLEGRGNHVGAFTVSAGTESTVVSNSLFESAMVPIWVPMSDGANDLWLMDRTRGAFTVGHSAQANDRTYSYIYIG